MDPEHRGKNNNAVPRKKADIKIQSTVNILHSKSTQL